jgi:hypothetical protein
MKILYVVLLLFSTAIFAQDRIFIKTINSGNKLNVPEGKIWHIDKVFISDGGGYAIKISNSHFKTTYKHNDTITFPYYIPEMEILTKKGALLYKIYYKEQEVKLKTPK